MIGYSEPATIQMYVEEYKNLSRDLRFENEGMSEDTIILIQERMNTVDTILRHEHNFAIGKDRL
jgi:hypothetical protein